MAKDFSQGKVSRLILAQAIPITVAQFVHILYNIVDRAYIGHMEGIGSMALSGVGLVFPLTTLILAFTSMFGNGGSPLFAIARGAGEEKQAEEILGQVTALLLTSSVILFAVCYIFRRPVLYAFGASDDTYYYANLYLRIYLLGTPFTMLATGLNGFINAQGFPRIGMGTILIGAILNLILDPIFIFALGMGVQGAALATIISQFASMCWSLSFFFGKKSAYRIRRTNMRLKLSQVKEICSLGVASFIVQGTNSLVQIVCNKTLHTYGGDLYIGIMTVINSVREVLSLPGNGIATGSQPVISFNYGAAKYSRVRASIRFTGVLGFVYLTAAWLVVLFFPAQIMGLFTTDTELIALGQESLKLYFYGFFFMAFQFLGQSTFTAMKCPKRSIFFSLFRKVIIVVPLTLLLPQLGLGVAGVFLAEPISNCVGGLASCTTMLLTVYRKLPKEDHEVADVIV